MNHVCIGHETILAAALAAAKAPTVPTGTRAVLITVDTAPVRFTIDGSTTPTATVGLRLVQNLAPFEINNVAAINNLSFIAESGSPNIQLAYFGSTE